MKTILLRFFIFLSFYGFGGLATVQGQVKTFYQTYLYSGVDKAYDLAPTQDGGYIMTGYFGVGFGTYRILIIKTDSLGDEQWHKIYGYPIRNESRAILPLADGGYMVGATTSGEEFSGDFEDIFILKLDENGDTLWTKTYVQDGLEYLFDIELCPDGGFIIAGAKLPPGASYADGYALKIDASGNKQWEQSYNLGTNFDIFWDVEVLPDSGYVFGGETVIDQVQTQAWLLRTDLAGTTNWSKHYGWEHTDLIRGGIVIDDEHIIMAGGTTSFSGNVQYDALIIKTDMAGDTIWTRVIDGGASEFNVNSIIKANNGNYLLGIANYRETTKYDIDLISISPDKEVLWIQDILKGSESEFIHDLIQTTEGAILAAGATQTGCGGCAFLLKLTEDGFTSSIDNNLFKIEQSLQVYPNPSFGLFYIMLPNSKNNYNISVFNSIGQLVNNSSIDSQSNLTTIDLSASPSGTYFLLLSDDKKRTLGRETLIKVN